MTVVHPLMHRHSHSVPSHNTSRTLKPAVDIFETDEGLIVIADIPGVDKDHLDVDIKQNTLTIQNRIEDVDQKENCQREPVQRKYWRQFEIPDHIDIEQVSAELKNGTLKLFLPKSEAAKPRRIEVTTH